jgi:hypothetical protein
VQPYAAVVGSPPGWSILGQLGLREVGEVVAFLAPPAVTKQSATGQEQCAGDTLLAIGAVDGISLLQGIEVSAPIPSLPGGFELQTVVMHGHAHVGRARGPHMR